MNKKRTFTIFSIYFLPLILIVILTNVFLTYNTEILNTFGVIAIYLLFILLIIKPLSVILAQYPKLRKLLLFRREIGIIIAYFSFAHGLSYFYYIQTEQWNYPLVGIYLGIFALIIMFILYITSNQYSMKTLGKWWKFLHNFVFLLFALILLHVIVIASYKGNYLYLLLGITIIILKILEKKKLSP